jgi:lipoate---protein ligase
MKVAPKPELDTTRLEHDWNQRQLEMPVNAVDFRVWHHRRPAIVLGCSQRALRTGCRSRLPAGVALVERTTGGGAVLSGPWMVSVSLVLPPDHDWVTGSWLSAYRWLGRLHAEALAGLGIPTRAVPPEAVTRANKGLGDGVPWACFGRLAPWELTDLAGRKLVGLAQRRQSNGVLLVAGTLCQRPDWSLLCDAMGCPGTVSRLQEITSSCDRVSKEPLDPGTLTLRLARVLSEGLLAR